MWTTKSFTLIRCRGQDALQVQAGGGADSSSEREALDAVADDAVTDDTDDGIEEEDEDGAGLRMVKGRRGREKYSVVVVGGEDAMRGMGRADGLI